MGSVAGNKAKQGVLVLESRLKISFQKGLPSAATCGGLLVDRLLADRDVAEQRQVVRWAASAGWSGHLRMMAVAASLSSPMQWITGMMHKVHVGLK